MNRQGSWLLQVILAAAIVFATFTLVVHRWRTFDYPTLVSAVPLAASAPAVMFAASAPAAPPPALPPSLPPAPDSDEAMAAALFHYLENPELCCRKLTLFGGTMSGSKPVDGDKFVCLDEGRAPPPGNCLVYSLGISNEWSFDRAITSYGCQVYAFDPSMTKYNRTTTEFGAHFYKIGLGGRAETRKNGWHMMTLTGLRAMLGHSRRTIDYLKIDIEGSEWEWLENDIAGLEGVSQMGMEVHLNAKDLRRHYNALWRIQEAGFKMIHSNPNRVHGRVKSVKGVKSNVAFLYELVWMKDG